MPGERAEHDRLRELLDFEDGRRPPEASAVRVLDDGGIADLLRRAHRIAVVGASPKPIRPSHGVMAYLLEVGYECVPVNPDAAFVLGRPTFPDLAAATAAGGPFDIVDVFRRWDQLPGHAREAAACGAGALWLQLGLVNWDAAMVAAAAGLEVVMDRCTAVEVRRMRRGPLSG